MVIHAKSPSDIRLGRLPIERPDVELLRIEVFGDTVSPNFLEPEFTDSAEGLS